LEQCAFFKRKGQEGRERFHEEEEGINMKEEKC
jgi:hypothetical protein